jgi:hypothetical protein
MPGAAPPVQHRTRHDSGHAVRTQGGRHGSECEPRQRRRAVQHQPGRAGQLGGGASGLSGRVQLNVGGGGATIELRGVNGTITCANLIETSDARLKEDIAPLTDALDKVVALRGVSYQSKDADGGAKIGFIGQEVAGVYPELVDTDADGYVALSYSRLTAVLVEAVNEQQRTITQQASMLSAVLRRVAQIETGLDA